MKPPPRRLASEKILSQEQQDIHDYFAAGPDAGNVVVEALAGTGKTFTIEGGLKLAPESRILYAVFNKRNQKEAEEKIKDPRVEVRTLHSLGYLYIKRVWSNAKPDDDVEFDRVDKVLTGHALRTVKEFCACVVKLVGFVKNTTINPTQQSVYETAEERDLITGARDWDEKLVCAALQVCELSKVKHSDGRISFDDMVWLPVACDWVKPRYELGVVDETQDMNLVQLEMIKRAVSGRIACVGDSRQCIYSFRGAAQDGMNTMKQDLQAAVLTLTTTYRCCAAVVKVASEIVPSYKAAPNAPTGLVTTCATADKVQIGDAILSRLNAPLMPQALSLLRRNIPARIEGRDIGAQLVSIVRSMRAQSVPNFIEKVEAWKAKQVERLSASKSKSAEKKIEQVDDIAATLLALAQDCDLVDEIETRLLNLFQDSDKNSKPAVVLSSVHKAKGLEWNRVFLLRDTFRKGQSTEEDNIWYVAVTRAKIELHIVGGGIPATEIVGTAHRAQSTDKLDNYNLPQGLIYHVAGNVVLFNQTEYVCVFVNSCRAKFVALSRKSVTVNNKLTDEETTFKQAANEINLSASVDPKDIVRTMDKDELDNFLTRGDRRAGTTQPVTSAKTNNQNESMSKKAKSTKSNKTAPAAKTPPPRRQAPAPAPAAAPEPSPAVS